MTNREIKFRIWDPEARQMHDMQWIEQYIFNQYDGIGSVFGDADNEKWMQYTGLKDKNLVEIYENDLLRQADDNTIYEVIYHKRTAAFVYGGRIGGGMGFSLSFDNGRELEVIGNIYENPELLEAA